MKATKLTIVNSSIVTCSTRSKDLSSKILFGLANFQKIYITWIDNYGQIGPSILQKAILDFGKSDCDTTNFWWYHSLAMLQ